MFQNCQVPLTGFMVFSDHLLILWVFGSCWGLCLLRLVYWYFCEIETKGKKSMGISKCVLMPVGSMCTDAAGEETADSTPSCSQDRRKWAERKTKEWEGTERTSSKRCVPNETNASVLRKEKEQRMLGFYWAGWRGICVHLTWGLGDPCIPVIWLSSGTPGPCSQTLEPGLPASNLALTPGSGFTCQQVGNSPRGFETLTAHQWAGTSPGAP